MENFTPVSAAIGGVLIGIAATLFMALNGETGTVKVLIKLK